MGLRLTSYRNGDYYVLSFNPPECTSGLIISGSFLRATETLTGFKNRIK